MTSQSGGGGLQPTQTVGGVLAGLLTAPSFAAGSVPAELGYVQITASQTGISATVLTDVTGLTLTVTVGTRPILLEVYALQADVGIASNAQGQLAIVDVTGSVVVGSGSFIGSGGAGYVRVRVTPAAGARTYKVQMKGDGTNAARFLASATGPGWFRISEA